MIDAQPAAPTAPVVGTITQPTCATATGSVILSGLPAGNWTINPGAIAGNTASTIISGLATGTYNYTVTNSSGCTSAASANVVIDAQPAAPAALVVGTITQPTCATATGSVILSGLPAGNWTINPGAIAGNTASTTISGLTPGSYTFTVTNAAGCTSSATTNLTINPASNLSAVTSKTDILCNGASTGAITVSATGGLPPYQYKIGSGAFQPSATFSSLIAGSYTLTIQDANLCSTTTSATIVEPVVLNVDYSTEPSTCPNTSDGVITLTATGGVAPFSILWTDGSTLSERSNMPAGEYSVIITDNNGCSKSIIADLNFSTNGSCLVVQEIITPNNDGFYDVWKIKNVEMYPDAEVKVYNRWGELVFNSRNISADEWDGTFKGKPLPTDSYHYVLYLGEGTTPVTGTITIIR